MSDPIKHECGIALLRLKKPLQFYLDKYGTALYGLNKMLNLKLSTSDMITLSKNIGSDIPFFFLGGKPNPLLLQVQ